MLNNLTNFFNLFTSNRFKRELEDTDVIAIGTQTGPRVGSYKPTAIQFKDLKEQLEQGGFLEKPYKVYVATLTQENTDDPTAVELENEINTVGVTRTGIGQYTFTNALFDPATTIVFSTPVLWATNKTIITTFVQNGSLFLYTANADTDFEDSMLNNTPIEIRVYN
jgi:hypothetical protein